MLKSPFSRFIVREESMMSLYKPGDHVLTFNWSGFKVGDVVVFQNEAFPSSSIWGAKRLQNRTVRIDSGQARMTGKNHTFYIKRVYNKVYNYVYIRGDNEAKSTRVYKVKKEQIVGKVILKY